MCHDNSKNYSSLHLKLEHIVVYENTSEELDSEESSDQGPGYSMTFSPFITIQTVKSNTSALALVRKL